MRYDEEWLAIVESTHKYFSTEKRDVEPPPTLQKMPTIADIDRIKQRFIQINGDIRIPYVDPPLQISNIEASRTAACRLRQEGNPQTDRFLQAMGLDHVWTIPYSDDALSGMSSEADRNEIDISDI